MEILGLWRYSNYGDIRIVEIRITGLWAITYHKIKTKKLTTDDIKHIGRKTHKFQKREEIFSEKILINNIIDPPIIIVIKSNFASTSTITIVIIL